MRLIHPRGDLFFLVLMLSVLLAAGAIMPEWLRFYMQVSMAGGLAALSVSVLMRAGLVSFGHGLYFCIGGYAAGMTAHFWKISDVFVYLLLGIIATGVCAFLIGFLMARYREIFFAMLSLALSMVLYGLLVKAEALGSTDGFNLPPPTYLGWAPDDESSGNVSYAFAAVVTSVCLLVLRRYLASPMGLVGDSIRENELRAEYLGVSVRKIVHKKYVLTAIIAGIGGILAAMTVGHVDPDMAYWTTSGHFVFVALLSGSGHVIAPLIGSFFLEVVRVYALDISPNAWQMILGATMLTIILFCPKGFWSLIEKVVRR